MLALLLLLFACFEILAKERGYISRALVLRFAIRSRLHLRALAFAFLS